MKVCNMCGNNVNDNENFCPVCGNNLAGIPQPANNNIHYSHQNPSYGNQPMMNQQQYQQPMYNQPQGYQQQPVMNQYYQPVSNNSSTTGEILGAIVASVGLFFGVSTLITVLTSFDEFYLKEIAKPEMAQYADNVTFWAISVSIFPVILGLIATIVGLKGKKKYGKTINKFTFYSGLACLVMAIINIIGVVNYFN